MLLVFLLASPAAAQNLQLAEQKIKAGMLYNFLKYTDWPAAEATGNIAVCLFDTDPFAKSLQPMDGRSVNQRAITIRTLQHVSDVPSCQLLIVNKGTKDSWPKLREMLAGLPVLTVSDYEGFVEAGGMIEFNHSEGHITVELNPDALAAAQLSVQPRLRNLMTTIRTQP